VNILEGLKKEIIIVCPYSTKISHPNIINLLQRFRPGMGFYAKKMKRINPANPQIHMKIKVCFILHTFHILVIQNVCANQLKLIYRANLGTDFDWNLMTIYGIGTNDLHKPRSNFYHVYRVNCLKEWVGTWYVYGVIIVEVPPCLRIETETMEIQYSIQPVLKLCN